jgi:hypothetical protein
MQSHLRPYFNPILRSPFMLVTLIPKVNANCRYEINSANRVTPARYLLVSAHCGS